MFAASHRYGFAAGSLMRFSTCVAGVAGAALDADQRAAVVDRPADPVGRERVRAEPVVRVDGRVAEHASSPARGRAGRPRTAGRPATAPRGRRRTRSCRIASTSDWCRCQPDGKKFGSCGQHMNDASSPRRAQTAFMVLRNRIIASAAASPSIGLNVNSNCPGPHSSSIERGGRPTSQSAVAERLEDVPGAVEARVGQELVAALDDVDLGRRAGLAGRRRARSGPRRRSA